VLLPCEWRWKWSILPSRSVEVRQRKGSGKRLGIFGSAVRVAMELAVPGADAEFATGTGNAPSKELGKPTTPQPNIFGIPLKSNTHMIELVRLEL
jgi:hypothetical protein